MTDIPYNLWGKYLMLGPSLYSRQYTMQFCYTALPACQMFVGQHWNMAIGNDVDVSFDKM